MAGGTSGYAASEETQRVRDTGVTCSRRSTVLGFDKTRTSQLCTALRHSPIACGEFPHKWFRADWQPVPNRHGPHVKEWSPT